jgi:hypothetical protein
MYHVEGWDHVSGETVTLYSTDWREGAIDWAKRYTKNGDTGGWTKISVIGTHEIDVDWNGDPVTADFVIWSYYNEPMQWSDNAMEEF